LSKFKVLKVDEEISIGDALIQSAQAADLAGKIAAKADDFKGLVKVANAWNNISNTMLQLYMVEQGVALDEENKPKRQYGFGGDECQTTDETIEEE
jgi:hypothetical protein